MGALITALAALGCFGGAMWMWIGRAQRHEIPEDRTFFVSMWALGFVVGLLALAQDPGFISGLFAAIAVLGSAVVLGLQALSRQNAESPIAVGDTIPEFTACDEQGQSFHSLQLQDSKLLIKFFRGHW